MHINMEMKINDIILNYYSCNFVSSLHVSNRDTFFYAYLVGTILSGPYTSSLVDENENMEGIPDQTKETLPLGQAIVEPAQVPAPQIDESDGGMLVFTMLIIHCVCPTL